MAKTILILICSLAIYSGVYAQQTDISSSYFFTYGIRAGEKSSYPNEFMISRSHAGYTTISIDKEYYLSLAYDELYENKTRKDYKNPIALDTFTAPWNYKQRMALAAFTYSENNNYYKLGYAFFKGDFNLYSDPSYDISPFKYSDYSNLFFVDYTVYDKSWYFGGGFSYFKAKGILTLDSLKVQSAGQINLRVEKIISAQLFASIKPAYATLKDGRKLLSCAFKLHYQPVRALLLKAGGSVGNRAYYFDADLFTIFNQYETQKTNYFAQAEYTFLSPLTFVLSYQHTRFEPYNQTQLVPYTIDYYIAGIKAKF